MQLHAARSSTTCTEVVYGLSRQYIRFGTYGSENRAQDCQKLYWEDEATPSFMIVISNIDKIPRPI